MRNLIGVEVNAVFGGVQEDIRYCEVREIINNSTSIDTIVLAKFSYVDGTSVDDEKNYQYALRRGMLDGKSVKNITDTTSGRSFNYACHVLKNA